MKIEELVAQVKQSTYPDWNVDIDRFLLEYSTRFLAAYAQQQEALVVTQWDSMTEPSGGVWLDGPKIRHFFPYGTKLYAAPIVPADTVRLNYIEENFHVLGFTQGSRDWFCEYVDDNRRADNLRDMIDLMVTAGEVKL